MTMGPFSVRLAPTPRLLGDEELDALYVHIQKTLVNYMTDVAGSGLEIRYFVITDVGIQKYDANVSTLRFGEAAFAFGRATPDVSSPDAVEIENWIRQAINTELVTALQETDFFYVTDAVYVSLTESGLGDNSGVDGVREDNVVNSPESNEGNKSRADVALISSVAIAGVAVLLLGALLVRSHNSRRNHGELRSPASLAVTNDTSSHQSSHASFTPSITVSSRRDLLPKEQEVPSGPSEVQQPRNMGIYSVGNTASDARSLADSESSWTVATEMGDSAAVHSVATHPSAAGLVTTESFEHDRHVHLQKDMLTTSWSGQNGTAEALRPLSESVLQPSYFSASHERRGRRQTVDTDESPRPFIFASHDDANLGEEVFLMPDDTSAGGNRSAINTAELL